MPNPWPAIKGLAYGGDYNPEQWPRSVWTEDARLMQKAGVNVVSLGIFSWALLEPSEGEWDFGWLDDVINILHRHGVHVDLATATASPPPWLTRKHPEILPVLEDGTVVSPVARQAYRPTSPIFKSYVRKLVRKMAERYGKHPAVVAWHVSNEFGCHNHTDYSEDAERAFRVWLERKYGGIEKLNLAWNTAFWSLHYGSLGEVLPPRKTYTFVNPMHLVDWRHFSSDALFENYALEREILHDLTPHLPVTTNFMVMGKTKTQDYIAWGREMDFVSNDHYVTEPGRLGRDELSFSANFCSGIAAHAPWWLMESCTSGVNWQAANTPRLPGEMAQHALTHVGHGTDAICFFQWRQSKAGAETWHASMLPHAGEDSRVFRDVVRLGKTLKTLAPLQGAKRVRAKIAILVDYHSWWAVEQESKPSQYLQYHDELLKYYVACLDAGHRVDIVPATYPPVSGSGAASREPPVDWSEYALVLAPLLHIVDAPLAARAHAYVAAGGHFVTSFWSGIVDANLHVHLGGHPGAFRELLGVRVEEFGPVRPGTVIGMDKGEGELWCEPVDLQGEVEVLRRYKGGLHPGGPAVTLKGSNGWAAYISTSFTSGLSPLVAELAQRAGVPHELPEHLRGKVELARREGFAVVISRLGSEEGDRSEEAVHLGEAADWLRGEVLVNTGEEGTSRTLRPRSAIVLRVE